MLERRTRPASTSQSMHFAISSAGRVPSASRGLERHRVGSHRPEVVGHQHVGRPHAVLQVRQARHLRRVAEPGVEEPIRRHDHLAVASPLCQGPPSPRRRPFVRRRDPLPDPVISTPALAHTRRSAPTPAATAALAPSRRSAASTPPRPPASTQRRRTPARPPPVPRRATDRGPSVCRRSRRRPPGTRRSSAATRLMSPPSPAGPVARPPTASHRRTIALLHRGRSSIPGSGANGNTHARTRRSMVDGAQRNSFARSSRNTTSGNAPPSVGSARSCWAVTPHLAAPSLAPRPPSARPAPAVWRAPAASASNPVGGFRYRLMMRFRFVWRTRALTRGCAVAASARRAGCGSVVSSALASSA